MISFVTIRKNGDVETKLSRGFTEDTLWKKCGFSKNTDFERIHTFSFETYKLSLYTKTSGKSNNINKYELPPPVDKELYYGTIAIVLHNDFDEETNELTGVIKYTKEQWEKDYEKLMGGFEDLDDKSNNTDEDEDENDELKNIPKEMKTSEGYLKDNFVIDDDEVDDEVDDLTEDEVDDLTEDEYDDEYDESELEEEDYI